MPEITSLQIADVFLHKFLRARQANTEKFTLFNQSFIGDSK